jgi:hypothetical protein
LYNALAGAELAIIIGQKVTEALRQYDDFSAAIAYDNPRFKVTIEMEAQEIEPKRVEVTGHVLTAALPDGIKTKGKSTRIGPIEVGPLTQPDKERAEAGLVVPDPVRNEKTGEVSDFQPDKMPF